MQIYFLNNQITGYPIFHGQRGIGIEGILWISTNRNRTYRTPGLSIKV